MPRSHIPVLLVALSAVLACSDPQPPATAVSPATTAAPDAAEAAATATPMASLVQATGGTVRAVPPGSPSSAAFLTLTSAADHAAAVVGARSSAARSVELHTHVQADGMMQMRRVDRFELPAGGTLRLGSGGPHIMLIGLEQDLIEGTTVPLVIRFDDGSELALDLPVRSPAQAPGVEPPAHE